jgi:hypothetical protein
MQPRSTDPLSLRERCNATAQLFNNADDLMSRNYRRQLLKELAFDNVKIGAAYSASTDTQQNFTRSWRRLIYFLHDERAIFYRTGAL